MMQLVWVSAKDALPFNGRPVLVRLLAGNEGPREARLAIKSFPGVEGVRSPTWIFSDRQLSPCRTVGTVWCEMPE